MINLMLTWKMKDTGQIWDIIFYELLIIEIWDETFK